MYLLSYETISTARGRVTRMRVSKPYHWFVACALSVSQSIMNKLYRNWNQNTTLLIQKMILKISSAIMLLPCTYLGIWAQPMRNDVKMHWLSPYPQNDPCLFQRKMLSGWSLIYLTRGRKRRAPPCSGSSSTWCTTRRYKKSAGRRYKR